MQYSLIVGKLSYLLGAVPAVFCFLPLSVSLSLSLSLSLFLSRLLLSSVASMSDADSIPLLIKNPHCPDYVFSTRVPSHSSVGDVKSQLSSTYRGSPAAVSQWLVCAGRLLADGEQLRDVYASQAAAAVAGQELILHLAIRGARNAASSAAANASAQQQQSAAQLPPLSSSPLVSSATSSSSFSPSPSPSVAAAVSTSELSGRDSAPAVASSPFVAPLAGYGLWPYGASVRPPAAVGVAVAADGGRCSPSWGTEAAASVGSVCSVCLPCCYLFCSWRRWQCCAVLVRYSSHFRGPPLSRGRVAHAALTLLHLAICDSSHVSSRFSLGAHIGRPTSVRQLASLHFAHCLIALSSFVNRCCCCFLLLVSSVFLLRLLLFPVCWRCCCWQCC